MKKFLRFLIILVLVVAAAALIIGLMEPTDIVVSRNTMIKAPKEAVFQQMVMFKNWPNWSPWYKMDPNSKITYEGTDGQPGSSYHWIGDDKKTGEGTMKNTAVNGTSFDFEVNFDKPRKGTALGTLKAEDTAGMTKATWTFKMHMPYPMNAMCIFMNMDKMLGGDFESGLANMKQYVESNSGAMASASGIEVKEVDYPGHTFEGFRKTVGWADIAKYCDESYGLLGKGMKSKINGAAVGIYYTWDTMNKTTDMLAAFPAYDTTVKVTGTIFTTIPPSKAFMAVHKGGYGNMMGTHMAIMQQMKAKGVQQGAVIEEYEIRDHQEPDSNKWVTNIYYLVK